MSRDRLGGRRAKAWGGIGVRSPKVEEFEEEEEEESREAPIEASLGRGRGTGFVLPSFVGRRKEKR